MKDERNVKITGLFFPKNKSSKAFRKVAVVFLQCLLSVGISLPTMNMSTEMR